MNALPTVLTTCAALLSAHAACAQITLPVASSFDSGPEGWTTTISAEWLPTGGNPGGRLGGTIEEPQNITAAVTASSAYHGDWSGLDGTAALSFDYRILDIGSNPGVGGCGGVTLYPHRVMLSGPGGAATWTGPLPQLGGWTRVTVAIDAAQWQVTSGSWPTLLGNVTELVIVGELVCNATSPDDRWGIDNVLLATACYANCDGSTVAPVLNVADFTCFLQIFAAGDPRANCDGSTTAPVLNVADFSCFLQQFAAGCP